MRHLANTSARFVCFCSNSALHSKPGQALGGAFQWDQASSPCLWGQWVAGGAQPVTSGSSSRLVAGSWGGIQGAAHRSPGCPSLPLEETHLPGSLRHPRSPPCRLSPDIEPPHTGWSGGREGCEQLGCQPSRARGTLLLCGVHEMPSPDLPEESEGKYPPDYFADEKKEAQED